MGMGVRLIFFPLVDRYADMCLQLQDLKLRKRQEDEEHKAILYLNSLLSCKNLMGERASSAAMSTCYERHCGDRYNIVIEQDT